ncbi:hypothetical protein CEXT_494981 [Caerostris extrusa]|uniref:Uncharacterized protein n=1 Tax=Caerostris extrusa TaxID=172846 RepID=A0AAV4M9H2_CAEEX|nr:hypothetical protein CEXT_494981 [Caerostris extrusa]
MDRENKKFLIGPLPNHNDSCARGLWQAMMVVVMYGGRYVFWQVGTQCWCWRVLLGHSLLRRRTVGGDKSLRYSKLFCSLQKYISLDKVTVSVFQNCR